VSRKGSGPRKGARRGGGRARGGRSTRRGQTARPQDHFGERARKEGYPARAVYKLQEIDRRVQLLRRGHRVLDLGAAPGSWSLYAGERVGAEGKVIGIDLQEITAAAPPHVHFLVLDMREVGPEGIEGQSRFDVVLSDMAPRTSGMRHRDQFLSYELFVRALEVSDAVLEPGGSFVGKLFQGAEFEDARAAVQQRFEKVRIIKPEASRDESYEVFVVGLGRRAPASDGRGDGAPDAAT
jgi:23S rRNA (uridine2552-2'-O)-methyltransferase